MKNGHLSFFMFYVSSCKDIYQGLPPLLLHQKLLSRFELWPAFIIYIPAIIYWIILTFRYGRLTIPLCANPSFPLSGMVGEKKSDLFKCAGPFTSQYIAPWISITNTGKQQFYSILTKMKANNLHFPLIAKPAIGCRGFGVKMMHTPHDLKNYLQLFPNGSDFLLQEQIPYEGEAGIFYFRHPGEKRGEIFSLGLKYQLYVFGNGKDSLKSLIKHHTRAKHFQQIYYKRHKAYLATILPYGSAFRLGFACSHRCGAIFKDGRKYITPALETCIDRISKDIKGFYFGRFDIRFKNISLLQQGKAFKIIEINGASSEATHMWDPETSMKEIQKTLCKQVETLFRIGHINYQNGARTPGLIKLISSWIKERKLVQQYPLTD